MNNIDAILYLRTKLNIIREQAEDALDLAEHPGFLDATQMKMVLQFIRDDAKLTLNSDEGKVRYD